MSTPARSALAALAAALLLGACGSSATILYQDKEDRPFALWATSADDVWLGLSGALTHYDGKAWTRTAAPTVNPVVALWRRSASELWAVGNDNESSFGSGVDLLRWDGVKVTAVAALPDAGGIVLGAPLDGGGGLLGTSDGAIVLAGSQGAGTINQRAWLAIFDLSGGGWTTVSPPQSTSPGPLRLVAAPTRTDLWVLDADRTLSRFDGMAWHAVGAAGGVGAAAWVADDDVYLATDGTSGVVRQHPLGSEQPFSAGLSDRLRAIVARSPTEIWGFGETSETSYSPLHVGCSGLFSGCGIGGPSSSQSTAIYVARWNGSAWSRHTLGDESYVLGLAAPGDGALYFLAGSEGALVRWPVGN